MAATLLCLLLIWLPGQVRRRSAILIVADLNNGDGLRESMPPGPWCKPAAGDFRLSGSRSKTGSADPARG